jgi:L-lactate dehydrogenase complex protein LldE
MKVHLMLTCLCDAFYGEVGIAATKVLRACGCEVVFPENQTCCGQPPYNSGDWNAAREIARKNRGAFDADIPIVTPSGSCAAMVREGYMQLFPDLAHIECHEVGEFLVRKLGIESVSGSRGPAERTKVAFHRACHGRGLGLKDEQERLLANVPNVELVPFEQGEQCCGFGGAFSATHGSISRGIGLEKLKHVMDSGAKTLASGDMGCLMHLSGLVNREGIALETKHYLQIIAEGMPG